MDYQELEEKYIAPTYSRESITLVRGNGIKVEDESGREYLDFLSGIAVTGLGHANREVSETLRRQSERLVHVSNLYHIREQIELGSKLAEVTPERIQKFFFCNSGTEAIEAALKLAVKYTGKDRIIALKESFHGRTSGSLGITWKDAYKRPFRGLPFSNSKFVSNEDPEELEQNIDDNTSAVVVEPIQGEAGVNVLSKEYMKRVEEICSEEDVLLIIDEIQTGLCRTGKWFASEHFNVEPDIITMAKTLGNGFPIGSMGAKAEVMDSFEPGDHASTFGGNPLACKVSKKVIEIMQRENIPEHVQKVGEYFKNELGRLADDYPNIVDQVRGMGLMLAIEIDSEENAKTVSSKALKGGFLINRTADKMLRFLPPLTVERRHIDKLIEELDKILSEVK